MIELAIDNIGGGGDGLALGPDGRRFFVPFTAPGDRVRVTTGRARGDGHVAHLDAVLTPGRRQQPNCPHFGRCGGCATQHLLPDAEAAWKHQLVSGALARRGIDVAVEPTISVPRAARRRATMTGIHTAAGIVFGFNAPDSHQVVDIENCPLLRPALNNAFSNLRDLARGLLQPSERSRFSVTALGGPADEISVDIVIERQRPIDLSEREALAAFADRHDIARIGWQAGDGHSEPVSARRAVVVRFANVDVAVSPGSFLQPSAEGEAAIVTEVRRGLDGATHIADLHAGLGTFTLPLVGEKGRHVHAVDADGAAIAALATAAGRASLGGRVSTAVRDLDARPLTVTELAAYDAVVFDPPRAGARAQAENLADAPNVRRIVGVSCNPSTFARDARTLIDGGFRLCRVVPIDQFPHAAHIELVAAFERS